MTRDTRHLTLFTLRGLLRREVVLVCLVIFGADLVSGILSPTFSLYAQDLGASLAFVGALSSIVGLTQLITSMPIGILSDRYGRKLVLVSGMLLFAVATTLFAFAPNALLLMPGRILWGLASVSTFTIGAAYVGDVVTQQERGIAFGLYATAMGMGFGVGPLISGAVAAVYGIPASYLVAAALALAAAGLGTWGLASSAKATRVPLNRSWRMIGEGFRLTLRDPRLLGGNLANLLVNTAFNGAIANFFPIYAANNHASQEAISSVFAVRALSSAAARLPAGASTSRLPSRVLMVVALALSTVAIGLMALTNQLGLLSVLLVCEGIAYGMFMPSGQAFTAENSTPVTRGQVVGAYGTAGSLGAAVSPLILGVAAEAFGVGAVFMLTAALMLAGLLAAVILFRRPRAV